MFNNRRNFSGLVVIFEIVLCVIGIVATKLDNDLVKQNIFSMKRVNIPNSISEILSHNNWTNNQDCLIELNAIQTGIENGERWAIQVVDSWGNFPSGVLNGNSFDPGSFSECFHIERKGKSYKTQYCIGKLVMKNTKAPAAASLLAYEPSISLGLCLPAACRVNHLESIVNDVIPMNMNNMEVKIPRSTCQFEEKINDWRVLDSVTFVLFGFALFLIVLSTVYDIICTVYNRSKHPPFIVFSIYTNGEKLFSCVNSGPSTGTTIQCIEGIRVLSLMWIVSFHIYRRYGLLPLRETVTFKEFLESYRSAIALAPIAVESYFAISGLLVSYKLFKLLEKNGKLDILSLYWQRYLRLTPLFAVCVLVAASTFRLFGNGPVWPISIDRYIGYCEQHWWSTLLYVQNYVNPNEFCVQPSWYLCVDMQLFIIAPALVYLIHRFKKTTFIAILASILCCVGWNLSVYLNNDLMIAFQRGYDAAYYPTHLRFPSWLIGFITGYILYEFPKGTIHIPKKLNVCIWTILFPVMIAIVLGNYPFYQIHPMSTPFEFGLFEPLSRIVWSIAVCYIIFACIHDSGGIVNSFLSLPFFQPFSKLSYAIYLNHCYLMTMTMVSLKIPPYFDELSAFQNFLSILMLSVIVAIPLVLAFELPIDAINKLKNGISQITKTSSTPSPVRLIEKNNNNKTNNNNNSSNKKISNGKKPNAIK